MTELLPCPFCGHKIINLVFDMRQSRSSAEALVDVICQGCSCTLPVCDGEADAIEQWNTRELPQSPGLSREAVLSAVIAAGNCGIGDTGPDGKWRAIACNDESLKGDRHYFREDCDCSKITDAVLTLAQGSDTRPLRTTGE